jgi:hypothetical protein
MHSIVQIGRVTLGRARVGVPHDEADEVEGTIATDDAIGFDPLPVLRALHQHGARAVVMGQVAGIMHGSKELTGDLDLLWDGDPSQAPRMAAAFASVSAALSDADGNAVPCETSSFLLPKVLFRTRTASGDCCTPLLPWSGLDIDGFIDRAAVTRCQDGIQISYVSGEDLLTMRRAVSRSKDRRRADELAVLLELG